MIRLFDIGLEPELEADIEDAVIDTFRAQQFVMGKRVADFEAVFARYTGAKHALGVASGTDALVIALRALGVGAGDEVIVPALSFYATAEAVILAGATPVLVDVDADTLNISLRAAEAAITKKTRALLPVHLYGTPAAMPQLLELAQARGLLLVEDAAQAAGASLDGVPVGSWGDACCYSFYPTKNLGAAGDAGAITTAHDHVAERVRLLRVHGTTRAYFHEAVGYTSRLDALQAEVLRLKLPYLDGWNRSRQQLAACYDALLAPLPVQKVSSRDSVYHLYVVRVAARDKVMAALNEKGVEARAYYPYALCDLPPLKGMAHGACPEARRAASELLALPLHPALTEDDVAQVVAILQGVLGA